MDDQRYQRYVVGCSDGGDVEVYAFNFAHASRLVFEQGHEPVFVRYFGIPEPIQGTAEWLASSHWEEYRERWQGRTYGHDELKERNEIIETIGDLSRE